MRVVGRRSERTFPVLLIGMVLLGIGLTIPGVAWPEIAGDLNRPIAQLGLVSLAYGSGYTVATLVGGAVARRWSIGTILAGAAAMSATSLALIALSPSWAVFLIAMFGYAFTGGTNDVASNTFVSIRRGTRSMGVLHGTFGVGTILGPLLVAATLALGGSWRTAFVAVGIGQLLYLTAILVYSRHASVPRQDSPRGVDGLRITKPLIWSLAVFFMYSGVGTGAGVWAFSYLTEYRSFGVAAGSFAVAAYWAGFTASRFSLGLIGDSIDPNRILRWSTVATTIGLVALWWSPTQPIAVVALIFTGFAHGPVFPLEIVLTPRRFGTGHTANVIGFEMASANVGSALLPAAIGLFVAQWGLGAVLPTVIAITIGLTFCVEMLRRSSLHVERLNREDLAL
ncbi:MAG: MFS transporter [Acidimicrobiia bacterium]|nr:MFS transporter [Acidimicrobiia bacterium]